MRALILAAGTGTRLGSLTADRPKPMLPVGGRPILEHLVALLRHHGITELAINLHYKADVIAHHFGDGSHFGVQITYSREPTLLGSAGAAKQLQQFLDNGEAFLVLYGDVLTDIDLVKLVATHQARGGIGTLALYDVEDPSRCGIVELNPEGRILRFVEKPPPGSTTGNLGNAGIYVLEPTVVRAMPSDRPFDFGADVFPALLANGQPLYGVETGGYVMDVGEPQRYLQAERDIGSGRFRSYATRQVTHAR